MGKKLISIFTNETEKSLETRHILEQKLARYGYTSVRGYSPESELIICIGGDGTLLETVHYCSFPECPIIGINTGHLGFFQEISPENLDKFISDYQSGEYSIQRLSTVEADVITGGGLKSTHAGLNEIVIKGEQSYSVHLHIMINGMPIERFSGDGIIVATSAGSTAYSYSLGGSIVDPRLEALQVTPIAPMNTTAYRSFTSSILIPAEVSIEILPELEDNRIVVVNDGIQTSYYNVSEIKIKASQKVVHLLRFKNYDFWNKVKTKFL